MAKEKRGLLQAIFGKAAQQVESASGYKLLSSYTSDFTAFSGNEWEIAAVRSAVGAFARNAAKVAPRHIRRQNDTYEYINDHLNYLLHDQPNEFMPAYAFYYRVASCYKLTNNAFIYPQYDATTGELTALYPIMAQRVELIDYKGELYCRFKFMMGQTYIVPYSEMIHLRNYYYDNDIFGASNAALTPVLETAHRFNESMSKFAELVAVIRGILKITQAVKGSDLNSTRDDFVRDNMRIENNGSGVIVTDAKYNYEPIKDQNSPIPEGQLKYIRDEINNYFGGNDAIIQNKATDDQRDAYYDGEIEPFYIQLSQALTNHLFTSKERGYGNEIIAESNRLRYAANRTKVQVATFLTNVGAATLDQILDIFGLPPIGGEEGKRRVQTLNAVNAEKADEYQLGDKPKTDEGDENNADQK